MSVFLGGEGRAASWPVSTRARQPQRSRALALTEHLSPPLQAADLDGEIDLSTCCDVTEYPVQRNYGFQIHVSRGGVQRWAGPRAFLPVWASGPVPSSAL